MLAPYPDCYFLLFVTAAQGKLINMVYLLARTFQKHRSEVRPKREREVTHANCKGNVTFKRNRAKLCTMLATQGLKLTFFLQALPLPVMTILTVTDYWGQQL